jgi:hypothetical protein
MGNLSVLAMIGVLTVNSLNCLLFNFSQIYFRAVGELDPQTSSVIERTWL